MDHNERFIRIEGLTKEFDVGRSFLEKGQKLRAVDNVSLDIKRGETLGLVGESGCGKSTFGRCVLRLIEPTEGKVLYENKDLLQFSKDEMRKMRRKLQMVFQDPYASLNPRMTVMEIIKAPLDVYKIGTKEERIEKVLEMAKIVGLNADAMNRYPHEFSGGQRQRIVIARALILNPEFIVCDEPVSALDVSIRSQVLNLIHDIQKKYNLSYLFISHRTLREMREITDKVLIGGLDHDLGSSGYLSIGDGSVAPGTTDLSGSDREKVKQVIRRRLEEGMKAAGPKFVLSGGCGWNHDALHRFPLVREVIDEVADEIAKGKNFYE